MSFGTAGRPGCPRRIFRVQNHRNPLRCQEMTSSSWTLTKVAGKWDQTPLVHAQRRRSDDMSFRPFTECRKTPTWCPSALARSDPGLLSISDPPRRPIWRRASARPRCQGEPDDPLVGGIQRPYAPSARMKPPASSLAHGEGLFFAWVTLSEHKWVTSRERRSGAE